MRIIMFSHCQDRSGAPIALMYFAEKLIKRGHEILFCGYRTGGLLEELANLNIENMIIPEDYAEIDFINLVQSYDLVIINTIVLSNIASAMTKIQKRTIWWLHESDDGLYSEYLFPENDNCIEYWAVASGVKKCINRYYPGKDVHIFRYCIPDISEPSLEINSVLNVAMIGAGYQKGEDVFWDAISSMHNEANMQVTLVFAEGGDRTTWSQIANNVNITILNECTQKEISELYKRIDVLVCPSRVDSLPIVVTQALQNGVACVISSAVGQSEFIGKAGWVFESTNAEELKRILEYCLENPNQILEKKRCALEVYNKYLSESKFVEQCSVVMKEW